MSTKDLIRKYNGVLSAREIAKEAGVTTEWVRRAASEEGISLAIATPVRAVGTIYVRVPSGQEEEVAQAIRSIMDHYGMTTKSEAIARAIMSEGERVK